MDVRIRIVGALGVEAAGARVDGDALGGRRSRLALAALATSEQGLASRDLAERVWDAPPATWAAALRGTIAALRTALGPLGLDGQALVVTTGSGWALAPGARVDLLDAEAAVPEASESLERDDPLAAWEQAHAALAELDGDVLVAERDAWIEALRVRREAAASALQRVVGEAAVRLGRFADARAAAEASLARDALDESAHRVLIRALAGAGDRAAAIRAFEACRGALGDELGVDPSPETTAVYLEILRSGSGPSGGLPVRPSTAFVGRDAELARVDDALGAARLATIVGIGGVGKSRLALEAATGFGRVRPRPGASGTAAAADPLPGGRFWVSLGELGADELVPSAIADAVGASGADPLEAVIASLAPAGAALLVLDGCEHHLDAVARAVQTLLDAIPDLRVLATSRERLGVDGEARVELAPLAVVGDGAPAVALLHDRLRARGLASRLEAASTASLEAIGARCGGVPLALELAAAQLETLSVGDLLDTLAAAEGPACVLSVLLDQGYDALSDDERTVFRAVAAVEGALPLPLVHGLIGDAVAPVRVARLLTALGEAGLVRVDRSAERWRYGLDEHLRPLAAPQLDADESRRSLLGLARAVATVPPEDARAAPTVFRPAISAALDGIRAVFRASLDGTVPRDEALDIAYRLHRHWASTGVAEGRYWLRRLLADAAPSPIASLARFAAGYLAYWAGDVAEGLPLLRTAAAELAADEPGFAARALLYAAGQSDERDEPATAVAEITESMRLARLDGSPMLVASVQSAVASILAERGDPAAATTADAAVEAMRATGAPLAPLLAVSALAAWRVGEDAAAARFAHEASPLLGEGPSISRAILAAPLAGLALREARAQDAAQHAALAVSDAEELGADRELPLAHALAARAALALGDLGAARASARRSAAAARPIGLGAVTAVALEAAASAIHAADGGAPGTAPAVADLAATAAALRVAGDRPVPRGLEPPAVAGGRVLPLAQALELAEQLLA